MKIKDMFIVSLLLAFIGGFVDSYSYLLRGKTFASMQTGNMILFGINIADGNTGIAMSYLIPIGFFVFGVIVSQSIGHLFENTKRAKYYSVFILEGILFLIVTFIPVGRFNWLANGLCSLCCAVQMDTFRKVKGYTYVSTMCTGNLRSASEALFNIFRRRDKDSRKEFLIYITIILFFILGVFTNAKLIVKSNYCFIVVSIVMLLILGIVLINDKRCLKMIDQQETDF